MRTPSRLGRKDRHAVLLYSGFAVLLALAVGAKHDLNAYFVQWDVALQGQNPWADKVDGR